MTTTFKEALYFFRINLLKLLSYSFSIGIIVVLLAQLLVPLFFSGMTAEEISPEEIRPFAQLLNLLIKPIYTGGLIVLIFSLATEQGKGIYSSLLAGIIRWPYMLIANVLTTLLIFVGLIAFVIPGIWIFSRLFLVPYLVMLKKQTPFEAVFNSFRYTKGYSFTILTDVFFLIMVFILALVILSVFQLLHPLVILLSLLLFQTMANVIYYRHYEILLEKNDQQDAIE
ncbi:MAG: hypothetical protein KZQ70_08965 [gamma proteobacterium symbiont of Lucinoma myriamae]|nr:hypothetical protein [gamma proteobacterium symbiont of Lucinoma myriamae]MCU7819967.1 hypothetical protein [gamma proteobacterium symbiont of Lucinoma myriamae]MCU7832637.1 hypothetical protein [gamma proteobacterium symbiont of Lucinoma myriamae]